MVTKLRIVGFTGTGRGLTDKQLMGLEQTVLSLLPIVQVHHGDCVGGDKSFAIICGVLGITRHAWPGMDQYGASPSRAFTPSEHIHETRPYLERDGVIAQKGVSGLIACPAGFQEELRSGTWATVRRARRLGRTIYFVYPDGRREVETPSMR